MNLLPWDELPEYFKNEETKYYYDCLYQKRSNLLVKRIFDIILSGIMIILLTPVFLLIALLIKMDSKGPIFYRQERYTQYGKVFRIFKFRTMVVNADQIGALVTTKNDTRITNIGQKIRKVRLDELPQLFNIFLGDMSFVGTRPEVKKYVDAYDHSMKATLLMPAGVTSLASIKFKDEDAIISKYVNEDKSVDEVYIEKVLPKKMVYNLQYIEEFSFLGDLKLMVDTVFAVLK